MTLTPIETNPAPTTLAGERAAAVAETLSAVRQRLRDGVDRTALRDVAAQLERLAGRVHLFPRIDFPAPQARQGVEASSRYLLNAISPDAEGDGEIALYLNSINPGKTTIPHNHDTWAVIVAVEGQEHNVLYRRVDDGSDADKIQLEVERQLVVEPGTHVAFMPQDFHSIHVTGDAPTLHLHLYGRPLESLTGRLGVDPLTGAIVKYNATQMRTPA